MTHEQLLKMMQYTRSYHILSSWSTSQGKIQYCCKDGYLYYIIKENNKSEAIILDMDGHDIHITTRPLSRNKGIITRNLETILLHLKDKHSRLVCSTTKDNTAAINIINKFKDYFDKITIH